MKILMVCLGNICRSPIAEGVLRHLAQQRGINLTVDSAGTSSFHKGEAPDKRAINCLKARNIDIQHLRARPFTPSDFEQFDRIYVMDYSNYNDVIDYATRIEHKEKVKLLLSEIYPDNPPEVPDPYYGGDDGFEKVFQLINEACAKICSDIEKKLKTKN